MAESRPIHVVAAVIIDAQGRILITQRPLHVHQGGLWEFPGGKLEAGETVYAALQRELHEELGIDVLQARPLICVAHDYPDKSVLLDIWRVDEFAGEPHGREGQPMERVPPERLAEYTFPAANQPILSAVNLPDLYLITPEPDDEEAAFLASLAASLQRGIRLVQLRAKNLDTDAYLALAKKVLALCRGHEARLILNTSPELVLEIGADGVQLSSERLHKLTQRPLGSDLLVSASCHNLEEIQRAVAVSVDFAVLSPVEATATHPGASPLGWEAFQRLTDQATFPVYALGGMSADRREQAFVHGAQGIAAVRSLWGEWC